ncbi:unnamed protein product [Penicillium olsonii]|uniref:Uncharacterized protein n=1 Tax=Penicillium olsonii TaxID=99116 RepID=A0A9W4I1P2_PENOL|nr:unnamed protein product [Penicillium olsonii]
MGANAIHISYCISKLFVNTSIQEEGPMAPANTYGYIINPNVRIGNGLPILEMKSELRHYEVQDPYGRGYSDNKDQYLCLWEVTPDEVVAHWDWDGLLEDVCWDGDKILPAFKEQNVRFLGRCQTETTCHMSTLHSTLPIILSWNKDELSAADLDHSRKSDSFSNANRSSSGDEENWQIGDDTCWDTDYEAEESIAIDDVYNILEGDF